MVSIFLFISLAFVFRPPVNSGTITSRFGENRAYDQNRHTGTDIGLPIGTPIYPVSWGTVKETGYSDRGGHYIIISHFLGFESRYLHLNEINVIKGQKTDFQTVIGKSGNTGFSTGPHLHYEIRLAGIPLPPNLLCLPGQIFQATGGYKIVEIIRKKVIFLT